MRLPLDVMCGGLRPYLRMCGHDASYAGDRSGLEDDDALLDVARDEERTVVTRDVDLARRSADSILLESRDVEDQLVELCRAGVDLELAAEPTRCGRCNGELVPVDPTANRPEYVPERVDGGEWRCLDCGQWFWRGSHWDDVAETLARVRRLA